MEDSNDDPFANAKEIFEKGIAGTVLKNSTPLTFKSDIKKLRELYLKRRDEWLKIESRNKFIQMLMEDPDILSKIDIKQYEAMVAKNAAAKAKSQLSETQFDDLMEKRDREADEVIALHKRNQETKAELEKAKAEVKSLQQEMYIPPSNQENDDEEALRTLRKTIGSENAGFQEAILIAKKLIEANEVTLEKLSIKEVSLISQVSQKDKELIKLDSKLEKLKSEQDMLSRIPGGPDKARVEELNALLEKFTPVLVQVKQEGDDYVLFYGENTITFDKNLKILLLLDESISAKELANVNRDTGEFRSLRLLRFLARVFSGSSCSS